MVLNLRWGTGAWVQDRHHFPSIDPHLCFEFLQFFLFIIDPWFNISDKNGMWLKSVRNLSGTNMYICMWSFFARYFSFYIIHCVHDKINNYFIFFLANIEIWPNKITAQIILNQDESGNPVWRYWSYFRFIWLYK